jgi:hypothetical protein
MPYEHGISVRENPTSLATPVNSTAGLQIVFGTAPINLLDDPASAVNKLFLCHTMAEAIACLGYNDDYSKYTLCQSMDANFKLYANAPVVFCNVLDPTTHVSAVAETECTITKGQATLAVEGILLASLVVKAGETTLTKNTHYIVSFDDNGNAVVTLTTAGATAAESVTALTISGNKIDPSKVAAADIIGGFDASTGKESGLELIKRVFPTFDLTAGLILAPGWSHIADVAAVMQAKCEAINGSFKCECIVDISTTAAPKIADVAAAKTANILTSGHAIAAYPMVKTSSGRVMYYSAVLGALYCKEDADNGNIPAKKFSNRPIAISAACLADGTEVSFDQLEANTLNAVGVVTIIKMNGLRVWGNNTCAYPGTVDPKERWIRTRRMFTWIANTFIKTFFEKVDDPTNYRLIESLVDEWNVYCSTLAAKENIADSRMEYRADENPVEQILNGKIVFHQYLAVHTPAEKIENILEFDPTMLQTALNGGNEE